MRRYKLLFILLAIFIVICGCSSSPTAGLNTDVTEKYIKSIESMDFSAAHKCFWKHAEYVKKETYIEDCEYILEKLGVTSITVSDADTTAKKEGGGTFSYTVTLHTKEAGDIVSSCSTDLIIEKGKTYIAYSSDLLLEDFEHNDVITRVTLAGQRGEIFTSDGTVVAQNSFADTVYIEVSEELDFKDTITRIDSLLDLSEKQLSRIKKDYDSALENGYGSVKVEEFSRGSIDKKLEKQLLNIDGVGIDSEKMTYQRYYPYDNYYCHVVGYANSPNEDQQKELSAGGYSQNSVWGKEGIEKEYNEQMLAYDGYAYQLRKDTYEIKRTLYTEDAKNGSDVILTIDSQLQKQANELLAEKLDDDQAGTAIVLNGKTGAVLAQASNPSFDANLFAFGISEADYKKLTEDKSAPLFNRATQGLYPPGSTIKPFTATAALNAGTASFSSVFPYTVSNNSWTPKNWHWLPVKRDEYVSPPLTMYKAMVHSDNIYFAWLGLEAGYKNVADYFSSIGIGEAVKYDLPTAKSNLINDDAEKNGTMLADMSFGHGQILITPIQAASMYTAFQNNGDMLTPYLVEKLGVTDGEDYSTKDVGERTVLKSGAVDSSYIDNFNQMFAGVVNEGTATQLKSSKARVYAKTGTAIKGDDKEKRISWIVAWLPDSDDGRIVVVVIETPVNKGNVKFAVARPLLGLDDK